MCFENISGKTWYRILINYKHYSYSIWELETRIAPISTLYGYYYKHICLQIMDSKINFITYWNKLVTYSTRVHYCIEYEEEEGRRMMRKEEDEEGEKEDENEEKERRR